MAAVANSTARVVGKVAAVLEPPAIGPDAHAENYDEYPMESIHAIAFFSALFFSLIAIGLTIHLVYAHMTNYHRESLQRHVYRILLMCPIYAVCSVIGLGFPRYSIYLDVIRDSYEAFTIYSFVKYLIAVLGEEKEAAMHLARKSQVQMLFPLNHILSKPWGMGSEMIYKCKYGALQYIIVKPACAVVVFIAETFDFYDEGEWEFDCAYPYVSIISNTSQIVAMYCLVQLFYAADEELAPWHPVPKFLSVKAVVFFTFWQGVVLQLLMQLGILVSYDKEFTTRMLVVTLQDWLVCFEMAIVAWYHHFAFPVHEYKYEGVPDDDDKKDGTFWKNLKHGMAVGDMVKDVEAMSHLEGIQAKQAKLGIAELVAAKQKAEREKAAATAASHGTSGEGDEEKGYTAAASAAAPDTEAKQRWKAGVGKVHDRLRPSGK